MAFLVPYTKNLLYKYLVLNQVHSKLKNLYLLLYRFHQNRLNLLQNKNNIIYKFFKLQNLEKIPFEKKIHDSKKINNIKWNIYSVFKVKELLNDNIKIKDLLSNKGYLFVTNQSDSSYAILIVGDNTFDSSYDDLRSNLYKNHIKYLLENMEIIPQYSNNFDINILKKLVENNITED